MKPGNLLDILTRRLREASFGREHTLYARAAREIEAKDKEIKAMEESRNLYAMRCIEERNRAETAERERDEAREALERLADVIGSMPIPKTIEELKEQVITTIAPAVRAARAITGENHEP